MFIREDDIQPFRTRVWLANLTMHGEKFKYITEAYETNWMTTVGTNIDEVEKITAQKAEMKYGVGFSCCMAAFHLCKACRRETLR